MQGGNVVDLILLRSHLLRLLSLLQNPFILPILLLPLLDFGLEILPALLIERAGKAEAGDLTIGSAIDGEEDGESGPADMGGVQTRLLELEALNEEETSLVPAEGKVRRLRRRGLASGSGRGRGREDEVKVRMRIIMKARTRVGEEMEKEKDEDRMRIEGPQLQRGGVERGVGNPPGLDVGVVEDGGAASLEGRSQGTRKKGASHLDLHPFGALLNTEREKGRELSSTLARSISPFERLFPSPIRRLCCQASIQTEI